jgi:hypothetical protein
MKITLFSILLIGFLISSCKKDVVPLSPCDKAVETGTTNSYTEKDTAVYIGKITLNVVDVLVYNCKTTEKQFKFNNLTENKIEVKIYKDTTFTQLFTLIDIGSKSSVQTFLPNQGSSATIVTLIKVKYK